MKQEAPTSTSRSSSHHIHCTICTDKNNFRTKVNDAKRITQSLKQLIDTTDICYKLTNSDTRELNNIYCRTHQHFMCGHCHKVNENELWDIEEDLKQIAYTLYMISRSEVIDKDKKGYIVHSCQRLLSGYYPSLARLFYLC